MQMKQEQLQSMQKGWLATNQAGFSLVEIILSSAIFVLLVTALVGAYLYGQESTALAGNRARANMLAEEGLEAVRNIRDPAYANLTDGTYGLTTTGNQWNLSGASDANGIFTRQVIVSTIDTKRKSVTANVTWQQNPQRTGLVSLVTRLTNWIASGIGDWSNPQNATQIDLSGNQDGLKIQVQGNYAYMTRAGAVPNFLVIDISDPESPSLVGSATLSGTPQNLVVSGNFAYVASDDNAQELQIINISSPSAPTLAGTYDAPGNTNANGVAVVGTTLYLVRASSANNEFNVINVLIPTLPVLLGSLDLGADGNDVVVSGTNAFLATSDDSQEMKVINISVPALPTLAGSLNLAGNTDATAIALASNTVFLSQGSSVFTVNITTPTTPAQLGSISAGGTINDIALNLGNNNTYLYLATSNSASEFQVINVSIFASPVLLGSLNITGTNPLFGIAYDATLDRAFAVGQSNTEEFVVIAPQ